MGLLDYLFGREAEDEGDEMGYGPTTAVKDYLKDIMTPDTEAFPDYDIVEEVGEERLRQDDLWGVQNHAAFGWLSILVEEVGEAAKAINENDAENYREELIQIAAVAVAAAASFDRNSWGDPWS